MPRLTLKQFQMPDYASQVPDVPRSERPLQKIADLLYVLHNVPWFKKKQEGESGISDPKSGVTAEDANEAVTDALVNGKDIEDVALDKAREPDFGLDQAMPIELQLMGIRRPFGLDDSTYEKGDGEDEGDNEKDDFEKALDDAERKRKSTLEQDPFEMSANKDKEGIKDMQRAAGLKGKEVDAVWGPRSEKARQRALHPEDEDEKVWADIETERYGEKLWDDTVKRHVKNVIDREMWGD